jgi:hypothetical protein
MLLEKGILALSPGAQAHAGSNNFRGSLSLMEVH